MAILSRRSTYWMFLLKFLVLSVATVSLAMIVKLSVPMILDFTESKFPVIWSSLQSWLTPPYLYVVINGIIITIAASSRFCDKVDERPETVKWPENMVPSKNPVTAEPEFSFEAAITKNSFSYDVLMKNSVYLRQKLGYEAVLNKNLVDDLSDFQHLEFSENDENEARVLEVKTTMNSVEEDYVISRSNSKPKRTDSMEYTSDNDKPPVAARFSHRKNIKASPEGKASGVSKPKRNDTLESTWKAITEGRPMPLTRHLKKSDTWEAHVSYNEADPQEPSQIQVKSESFTDRDNPATSLSPSSGSGKFRKEHSLRKESSPSQDELNRRVEAFIKKFNEEMRLQREESLNQYMAMVNRGAH